MLGLLMMYFRLSAYGSLNQHPPAPFNPFLLTSKISTRDKPGAMALSEFPAELLLIICKQLDDEYSINALSQTNSRLYGILNGFLYRECARHPLGFGPWLAVRHGSNAALLEFIAHGADIEGCGVSVKAAIRKTLVDAQIILPDEKGVGEEDDKETRNLDEYYPRYANSQKARTTTPTQIRTQSQSFKSFRSILWRGSKGRGKRE